MKNALKVVLAVVAVLGFVGCASMGGGELVDGEGGAPGSLTITHNHKRFGTITAVLMSRCGGYTMGFNRLDSREHIERGQKRSWTVSPGCWDVQFGDGVSHQGSAKVNIVTGKEYVLNYAE